MATDVTRDAVLLIGFGGPEGREDVLPFLRRVTAGKNIPDERLIEVGRHYEHFGGVSPINAFHRDLMARWEPVLQQRWPGIRLYWGNRNAAPFIVDAMQQMRRDGVSSAVAAVTSAFSSFSGCRQYRQDIAAAGEQMADPPEVVKAHPFFDHPLMVDMWADSVRGGLRQVGTDRRVLVLFSTHSIPSIAAAKSGPGGTGAYVAQHRQLAAAVMEQVDPGLAWDLCYQSRSGPPGQPWLEPDVSDRLAAAREEGFESVVLVPLGFISDHIEVLWDLDEVAMVDGSKLGLAMARTPTPGSDDRLLTVLTDLVAQYIDGSPFPTFRESGPLPACPADCCLPARPPSRPQPGSGTVAP
jgi:ferrochelatase